MRDLLNFYTQDSKLRIQVSELQKQVIIYLAFQDSITFDIFKKGQIIIIIIKPGINFF